MKLLKNMVKFLIIFYVGQWIMSISLDAIISKSSFRFSQLYSKSIKMNNKILCIGNSRGVNSFYSPYINSNFTLKSYNLSYNGLSISMEKTLLEDYLDNHKPPKVVFIEVSNIFNSDSIVNYSSFNMYSSKSVRLNKKIKETNLNTYILSTLFPLYRYNTELLFRNLFYLYKSDQDWVNRYTISKDFNEKVLSMPSRSFSVNVKDLFILCQIIASLKTKNIEVCLFVAPYLPNYLSKIKNLNLLIAYITQETGLAVIDLSNALSKSDYFVDRVHTNEEGAKLIANLLMKSTICHECQ